MFEVGHIDGPPRFVELRDTEARSLAVLAPERGGMLTRLRVRETDVLYLDEVSFANAPTSVRGGVPVLFPAPGNLAGGEWRRGGREGRLRRHGFARDLPWTVVQTDTAEAASATLRLTWSEATRNDYPWDFQLDYTYSLKGAAVTIEQRVSNGGAMPFAAGLHPYFLVPDAEKAGVRIETPATRAFDNVRKVDIEFAGFDLTAKEVDMHLRDHGSPSASMSWGGKTVKIDCSPEMTHWVVWTLAGWDFVCLEPWTSPGDSLNTGDRLLWLPPGDTRTLTTRIELAT